MGNVSLEDLRAADARARVRHEGAEAALNERLAVLDFLCGVARGAGAELRRHVTDAWCAIIEAEHAPVIVEAESVAEAVRDERAAAVAFLRARGLVAIALDVCEGRHIGSAEREAGARAREHVATIGEVLLLLRWDAAQRAEGGAP